MADVKQHQREAYLAHRADGLGRIEAAQAAGISGVDALFIDDQEAEAAIAEPTRRGPGRPPKPRPEDGEE